MKTKFERVSLLPPYVFAEINDLKAKERLKGRDIIDLGKHMKELEPYIANNDGSLYRRIKDLQSKCVSCRRDINNCTKNLDYIREAYEPKYPKVFSICVRLT